MSLEKIFRRTVSTLIIVSILLFSAAVHAEIYTGEGKYIMSEGENLGVAKERAKADAMRNAAEKAGTYIKSYTRTKNLVLEEDIIETMTANILKLVESPHFYPLKEVDNLEGILIRVTVKVQIDDSDINRWLNKNEQEKSMLVAQNEALRKANTEQARQIENLKRQLANATTKHDKETITENFAAEDKKFLSNQKVDAAQKLFDKGDYDGAIKLCNEAIELDSDNALAWGLLGIACGRLGQYERAIVDFNKAIKLNPNDDIAYNNRGVAYSKLGNKYSLVDRIFDVKSEDYYKSLEYFTNAIQDFNKAIELNPNSYSAYNNLGIVYSSLDLYELAIQKFNKAIQINPNYASAYHNRGAAFNSLKKFKQAITDYDKAIELDPHDTLAKVLREKIKELGH
ncbi:MAG: tetratricopeptide repeat protein [Selenomonadaceae bacterium]|nr:tetratricopeptide repeat protein [Selenomonadaceae bacterium]